MKKSVFILGLGHIGAKLALKLHQRGFLVTGTSTAERPSILCSDECAQINHLRFKVGEALPQDLSKFDIVISTLTPASWSTEFHLDFFSQCSEHSRLFAFSSTSVYAEDQGEVDEQTQPLGHSPRAQLLIQFENQMIKEFPHLCILRPGGFLSEERHPVKSLVKKSLLEDGEALVNLVREEDVVAAILFMIEKKKFSPKVNIVADEHPKKADFYIAEAEALGLKEPNYQAGRFHSQKIVHSRKLLEWGFKFQNLSNRLS